MGLHANNSATTRAARGRESDWGRRSWSKMRVMPASPEFQLVVMGTGPVGKTSLINALLGRSVGETGATMGTTRAGQVAYPRGRGTGRDAAADGYTRARRGRARGLGPRGSRRSTLATGADLLVFVVDHDLTRADCQTIFELSRQGKRLIVVLNKKDRFTEEDREAIMAKLRERLAGFVPVEDIVAVAAAPAPVQVRARKPDGTTETVLEADPPDLEDLECRVAAVLEREGDALRAGNLLLRARLREQAERDQDRRQRRARAAAIIDRHQWLAAVTAFANPVLALGPMAVGAVQLRMLSEMAAVYDAAALRGVRREGRAPDGPDALEAGGRRGGGQRARPASSSSTRSVSRPAVSSRP